MKMQKNKQEKNNNEGGAAAEKILEDNDEVSNEDVENRSLIEERRNTAKGEEQHLKEVSKQIRKCIRDKTRSKREEKIQRILEECRGVKNISCIKSASKRVVIPKVKIDKGETITPRRDRKCLR